MKTVYTFFVSDLLPNTRQDKNFSGRFFELYGAPRFREDRAELFGREFCCSVVGQKPVLLLLDVVELRVAEAEHLRHREQNVGQPFEAGEKRGLVRHRRAVSPSVLSDRPADAAVFADEKGQGRIEGLPRRVLAVKLAADDPARELGEGFLELFGVLLVVVNIVDVAARRERAAPEIMPYVTAAVLFSSPFLYLRA